MEITSKTFRGEVLEAKTAVFVEFWGSWCPPCKIMDPFLAKREKEFEDKIKIGKVNTDINPALRNKYDIRGLPTFIVFKNGKEVERHVAAKSEEDIRKIIGKHF